MLDTYQKETNELLRSSLLQVFFMRIPTGRGQRRGRCASCGNTRIVLQNIGCKPNLRTHTNSSPCSGKMIVIITFLHVAKFRRRRRPILAASSLRTLFALFYPQSHSVKLKFREAVELKESCNHGKLTKRFCDMRGASSARIERLRYRARSDVCISNI